jgi:ABC-type oligopeptide transport system substrate-binding subunit
MVCSAPTVSRPTRAVLLENGSFLEDHIKSRYLLIAISAIGLIVWLGIRQSPPKIASVQSGKLATHRSVLQAAVDSFDPLKATDTNTQFVVNHIYDGLVTWSFESGISGLISDKWQIEESGRRYVFSISPNAYFEDGSKVTAADIFKCFSRALNSKNYFQSHLSSILQIKVENSNNFVIELKNRDSNLLYILAGIPGLIYKERPSGQLLSSGPFRVSSEGNEKLVLIRNENYKNHQSNLQKIEFTISTDKAAIELAKNRQVDDTIIVSDSSDDPRTNDGVFQSQAMWVTWAIGFDQKNPSVRQLGVRQRISQVLPSTEFVKLFYPEQEPAYGFIPPGMPGYHSKSSSLDDEVDFNANWGNKPVKIFVPRETAKVDEIVKWINEKVKGLPFRIEATSVSFRWMVEKLGTGVMPGFLMSFNSEYPAPSFYLASLRKGSSSNFFNFEDKLTHKILDSLTTYERGPDLTEKLKRLNYILQKNSVIIPLMHFKHRAWSRNCVQGIKFSPVSEAYFNLRAVQNLCEN